jgi:hypothetical protein
MAKKKKPNSYQQIMDAAYQLGQMQNVFAYRFRELQGIHDAMSLIGKTPNAVISPEATMALERRVAKIQKEIKTHCEGAFDRKNKGFSDEILF